MADAEPDFPEAEYAARLERAQRAMHDRKLDALLLMTEAEVRYFTGFRTLFWQSPTRPWFLIVPARGKPVAAVPEIGARLMRDTWLDDVRSWSSPHPDDDGISLVRDVLQGLPKAHGKVGIPMGRESSLRMPLNDFRRLGDRLPGIAFVDATPLIQALRVVKSAREIDRIAEICRIASDGFDNATALFHPGQPLDDAFRAFRIELLQRGADDVPYLVGGAGPDGYGDVISPPGPQPIRPGDVLMLDTGATKRGYFCDFDRNFGFVHASDTARRAYDTLWRATEAALNAVRPGMTCAGLHRVMAEVIGQGDSDVGRFGHGLGMQLTEHPSLIGFDDTVLQANMVITLEPSLTIRDGCIMVHEENLVVRDGRPTLLSTRAPAELPVLHGSGTDGTDR